MATGRIPTTANSPLTAKGDLFTFSTGSAKLAVGNNGETLVADSSTSTGLRYTAGNPIPNPVINSCYDIWQRGTTFTIGTNTYGPDRWLAFRGAYAAGSTMSRQLVNDSTNLPNIQYCTRIQRDVSNTSTQGINFQYWQETSNSIAYAGKTVTFSFYARAGANYSPTGNALSGSLYTGTGTDQNGATVSYTGIVTAITVSATLTTTWQRFTGSATLATNTNEFGMAFTNTPVGTAGAADYFEVTGVQVDIGSVALPIRRNGATIQGELAACQRYYFKTTTGRQGVGYAKTTTVAELMTFFPVEMRIVPTALEQTGTASDYLLVFQNTAAACSAVPTFENGNKNNATTRFTVASGLTAGNGLVSGSNSGSSYLAWSTEL